MMRGSRLLLLPVVLTQCLFFVFIARHRFANGDEGFYLLASRLVLLKKTPYVDFSYVQAPLLPYVYAAWMKVTSVSWASARLFSALVTTLLGALVYEEVRHQTGRWLAGFASVVLFASSTLVFACFPTVHTFSLSAVLLFAAYMVFERSCKGFSSWPMGLAGILFGLSVDTRSYLILILPVFLWWICRDSRIRAKASTARFIGGLAVGLLPCLCLFVASPGAFWFNNLGYHAMRSDSGLLGAWLEKLTVLLMFFLGGPQGNGIQNSILFFASISFVFSTREFKGVPRLAFRIAVVLGLVSLLPTPVYPGYFSLCIPFFVLSAVGAVTDLFFSQPSRRGRVVLACTTVTLLAVYLAAAVPDLRKYLVTGEGIASVGSAHDKSDWRLENIVEVSRAIDHIAAPGEAVASLWPGYIFQTHAVPWPGLENDFVLPVADKMTAQQRQRYHVLSLAEIQSNLSGKVPRVVVLGNQNKLAATATGDRISTALERQRYNLVRTIGDTSIYACCSKP